MQNFVRKLLTEWRRLELPFSEKTFIIAASGGADSCSLSFALNDLFERKKITNNFIIAHYNHKLRRDESERDAEFVCELAKRLNFKFILGEANNKPRNTENTEQWARLERYKFLQKVAEKQNASAVLTAHTINDQAETLLLNLFRGSGLDGLSGMKSIRGFENNKNILLIRPFLKWATREDVLEFTKFNNIHYVNDSMNEDLHFKRVLIRKKIIPKLKKFNPKIQENLANTASLIEQDNQLLNKLIFKEISEKQMNGDSFLRLKKLKSLSEPMLYRVLRNWLLQKRGNLREIDTNHITAIVNLIHSQKSGKIVELPGFAKVIKDSGKIIFQKAEVEK